MKFSKVIVLTMFVLLVIFSIAVLVIFAKTSSEPSTLIGCVFAFFTAEGGCLALIKTCETKHGKKDNQDSAEETATCQQCGQEFPKSELYGGKICKNCVDEYIQNNI